jgi:hypothetical protein
MWYLIARLYLRWSMPGSVSSSTVVAAPPAVLPYECFLAT